MGYVWQRWLADEFRAAGLTVIEVEGWKNRGRPASIGGRKGLVGKWGQVAAGESGPGKGGAGGRIRLSPKMGLEYLTK